MKIMEELKVTGFSQEKECKPVNNFNMHHVVVTYFMDDNHKDDKGEQTF